MIAAIIENIEIMILIWMFVIFIFVYEGTVTLIKINQRLCELQKGIDDRLSDIEIALNAKNN